MGFRVNLLKALWQGWKRIAHKIGVVQTFIIMTVFYFLVIGPSALIAALLGKDLLRIRRPEKSYYRPHPPFQNSLDDYTHLS